MVSSEEKNEFVDKVIAMAYEGTNMSELQKQIKELLLRDTGSGKLYKYRSFDANGYSIKNLQDGTLHCSRAEAFNDPFDCKVGVSVEAFCGVLEELICEGLNVYISIIRGEKTLDECDSKYRTIIEKHLNYRSLVKLAVDRVETDDVQRIIAVMEAVFDVIRDLLSTVITNKTLLESLDVGIPSQAWASISDMVMSKLADEKSTLIDYASANGVADDVDEIEAVLQLGQIQYPETKETIASTEKAIDRIVQEIANQINSACLIGCLSTDYKNRLQWSHYADSHRGFCIEYDFCGAKGDVLNQAFLLPVIYSEKRPSVPWKAALVDTDENRIEARMQMTKALLTKDAVWEYENEWRILLKSDSANLKMPNVTCIYLGKAISEENRNRILEIARENNIPVKQMWTDRGSYELHAVEI